jgi:flagellar biosynthetic protein FliO
MTVTLQADPGSGLGVTPSETLLSLAQSAVALVAVCFLAWFVLRWGARRGLGGVGRRGSIRVLERVPLDARRSLVLVQVGKRTLLLGTGDGAAPSVLRELDPGEAPPEPAQARSSFVDVLRRLARRSE